VDQKERNEDRRDTDGHKPLIPNMAGWMKDQAFRRKLLMELPNHRLQRGAFEAKPEG
jgi:hypothetical protein